ncbi:hypothetical protein [Ruminococcus sp.]
MDIKEIFKDIVTDVNDSNQRIKSDRRERVIIPLNLRQRAGEYLGGWLAIHFPQFIGFILGLALTRMIGLHGAAYPVIGGLCALAAGTYKSISFDRISFAPAVVRNIILMLLFCGALAFIDLLSRAKA